MGILLTINYPLEPFSVLKDLFWWFTKVRTSVLYISEYSYFWSFSQKLKKLRPNQAYFGLF